jgi:glycosyltransferase involved in cell wall biosynthesis
MKRALVIAYFFPPIGGGGVQRAVKFARYLPEFGYEPVIVTGDGGAWMERLGSDATLTGELPSTIEVHRIAEPEPPPATVSRERLQRWLRVESAWKQWWVRGAIAAAAAAGPVDVVFATMSPFESAEVAAPVAARLGVPWVADLRDPWALDEMLVWPTAVQRRAERRRMQRDLARADAIVMNTPEAAAELGRAFPELAARTISITNGFDAADFEAPVPARDDDAFRIVHAGFLHTAAGRKRTNAIHQALGGSNAEVDFLTRSHVLLLEAVEAVLSDHPELERTLEVHLVGPQTDADREASARFVNSHGYLPHDESVALVRSADLLFLPMHNLPSGYRARIVPGKTYEYLASGRPILAAVPDGDARDLLERAGTAFLTRPDDVAAMSAVIVDAVQRRDRSEPPPPDPELLAGYERRELTRRLAALFDGLIAERGGTKSSPGSPASLRTTRTPPAARRDSRDA